MKICPLFLYLFCFLRLEVILMIAPFLISNFLVLSEIRCSYLSVDFATKPGGTCTDPDGVTVTDMLYQTTCSFECSTGYERTGSESITCQLSGNWSPDPPTCERKKLHVFA